MDAVVFDWDGTLVDTLGALYEANLVVMRELGLPFDRALYRRHFAPDWRLMYRRLGVPDARLEEANEIWMTAYDRGIASQLFDGVTESLDRLTTAGRRLGLVTAGDREVVEPQLERLGIADRFEARVFGDDLPVHKPDPAPLRRALELLGIGDRPSGAAYVGDVPDDMRMARSVGARGVGIVSALGEADALLAAGATEIAGSVSEWVDRTLGIMRVDRSPGVPAI